MTDRRNSTPFDICRDTINDLMIELRNWADGEGIQTQEQADVVADLKNRFTRAKKEAKAARKDEEKPHMDARIAVVERYRPMVTDAGRGKEICVEILTPFLKEQARLQAQQEREARERAEAADRTAQAAFAKSGVGDIEAREEADRLAAQADIANREAGRISRQKAHARGGARAVSLRTSYRAEITDMQTFAAHVWTHHRADLEAFLEPFAQRLVNGKQRSIPGVEIIEERTAA